MVRLLLRLLRWCCLKLRFMNIVLVFCRWLLCQILYLFYFLLDLLLHDGLFSDLRSDEQAGEESERRRSVGRLLLSFLLPRLFLLRGPFQLLSECGNLHLLYFVDLALQQVGLLVVLSLCSLLLLLLQTPHLDL